MGYYLQPVELLNGECIRFWDANSLLSVLLSEATNPARWLPYLQGYHCGNYCVILPPSLGLCPVTPSPQVLMHFCLFSPWPAASAWLTSLSAVE